jgi:hypothetical protein
MAAEAVFRQADLNSDGRLDFGEFRNFLGGQNAGVGAGVGSWESSTVGGGAGWGSGVGWGSGAGWNTGAGWGTGAGWNTSTGLVGSTGFESSGLESSVVGTGLDVAGGYDASYGSGGLVGGATSYETVSGGVGLAGDAALVAGGAAFDSSAGAVQQVHYSTDSQGLFQDPNPTVIRRANPSGVQTYQQNIRVRFLQPPPVPPPGPLIVREVRPPQPPVPPPLRVRQQAPPLPQPPPLVLRERPPVAPPAVASQTVVRRLAAIPVPPRSVIIERLPAAPPRPRDIIIERWIPYGPRGRRRTIVQRAAAARAYAAPRNVIIQYEPVQVRVVRNFQRLGVVQANPALYLQTYGATLLDAGSLLAQARAAGVVEDISPPGGVGYSGAAWGQEGWDVSSGLVGGANVVGGGVGLVGGGAGLVTGGAEVVDAGVVGGLGSSSVYESSSYSSGGVGGLGGGAGYGGLGAGYGGSWGSSGYSTGGVSGVDAAFAAADTNTDGTLDQGEFRQFLSQNL